MGLVGGVRPHPRAIIFDLDRCLIDSRNAWRYCIEESIAAAIGRRTDAGELVEEYHIRPWRDALQILAPEPRDTMRCEDLCATMYERSAMKKLLVHEGVGMALDALRGERIELGAISRLPHSLTVKQVQSTGLDRFLAVVAATPAGERWHAGVRIQQCLSFLEAEPERSAYAAADRFDIEAAKSLGLRAYFAAWAATEAETTGDPEVDAPGDLHSTVLQDWASSGRV
ncbi:MAG: HAD family hydrolase [Dehalococcoidia bacterium]